MMNSTCSFVQTTKMYSPGEASPGILTSISVTAYEAVFHSKCKDQPVATSI